MQLTACGVDVRTALQADGYGFSRAFCDFLESILRVSGRALVQRYAGFVRRGIKRDQIDVAIQVFYHLRQCFCLIGAVRDAGEHDVLEGDASFRRIDILM